MTTVIQNLRRYHFKRVGTILKYTLMLLKTSKKAKTVILIPS